MRLLRDYHCLGRTLDIDYNLSTIMGAIKTKDQQNHSTMKFLSTPTTMNSRRRHAYLGSNFANADVDTNSWKQNAAQSQVRLN